MCVKSNGTIQSWTVRKVMKCVLLIGVPLWCIRVTHRTWPPLCTIASVGNGIIQIHGHTTNPFFPNQCQGHVIQRSFAHVTGLYWWFPLATLLLSQWVFGFIFVLPSPTQHGILLAGLHSLFTREDVSVRIVPVNKHQTSGKLLVAKHCMSKVIFTHPSDDLNVQFISICL